MTDTTAIYALVDQDDIHHKEALNFLKRSGERLILCVLETTLYETVTLINGRL